MSTPARAAARRSERTRRAAEEVPRSQRRERKQMKHVRRGPFRDSNGDYVLWHTTRRTPWVLKAKRRAANAVARASRKVNR